MSEKLKPREEKAFRVAWLAVYHGQRMLPKSGQTEQLISIARALDEVGIPEEFNEDTALHLYYYDVHFHSAVDLLRAFYPAAIRRETIEECKSIVSNAITGLEDGPYGKDIEAVIAGVLESCKARISALKEE